MQVMFSSPPPEQTKHKSHDHEKEKRFDDQEGYKKGCGSKQCAKHN
jgi:hypothetical protein